LSGINAVETVAFLAFRYVALALGVVALLTSLLNTTKLTLTGK